MKMLIGSSEYRKGACFYKQGAITKLQVKKVVTHDLWHQSGASLKLDII